MGSSLGELRNRIVNHLQSFSFSILTTSEYQVVSRLLVSAGVHREVTLRKIPQTQYYILEIDKRAFISECKDLARKNEATNVSTLVNCVEARTRETLSKVVEKLIQVGG
ncbi:MAG: hypothetical protein QXP80_02570 [Zestosphaera sp.]